MSKFSDISRAIEADLKIKLATVDRDAEWQRVNTYIADCLKDGHVLYSKLARLQSDFGGAELKNLEKISEAVLDVGSSLSEFSRTFFEGRSSMTLPDVFGSEDEKPIFGGTPDGPVFGEAPSAELSEPDFEVPESTPSAEAEPIDMEFDYQDQEPQE
jgi:hypothetical protein